ncbi:MAG: ATP-grasp domain-containing protein, partial [Planctomycetota bacterium]
MMRIAIATCASLPDWEVDDRPLFAAFEDLGVNAPVVAWDDGAFDWAATDACLIRTTWDYQDRLDDYLQWVDHVSGCTSLYNPPAIVRWNTHK